MHGHLRAAGEGGGSDREVARDGRPSSAASTIGRRRSCRSRRRRPARPRIGRRSDAATVREPASSAAAATAPSALTPMIAVAQPRATVRRKAAPAGRGCARRSARWRGVALRRCCGSRRVRRAAPRAARRSARARPAARAGAAATGRGAAVSDAASSPVTRLAGSGSTAARLEPRTCWRRFDRSAEAPFEARAARKVEREARGSSGVRGCVARREFPMSAVRGTRQPITPVCEDPSRTTGRAMRARSRPDRRLRRWRSIPSRSPATDQRHQHEDRDDVDAREAADPEHRPPRGRRMPRPRGSSRHPSRPAAARAIGSSTEVVSSVEPPMMPADQPRPSRPSASGMQQQVVGRREDADDRRP